MPAGCVCHAASPHFPHSLIMVVQPTRNECPRKAVISPSLGLRFFRRPRFFYAETFLSNRDSQAMERWPCGIWFVTAVSKSISNFEQGMSRVAAVFIDRFCSLRWKAPAGSATAVWHRVHRETLSRRSRRILPAGQSRKFASCG